MHTHFCTNIYIDTKNRKGEYDEAAASFLEVLPVHGGVCTGNGFFFSKRQLSNITKPDFQHGLHTIAFITFSHCVLMYKGKDYSAASKYSVLKGG